jgi:hypothetical protein
MRKFLIFTVFILSFTIFGKEASWYKYFEGKIGEYPVIVHMHRYGDQLSGS